MSSTSPPAPLRTTVRPVLHDILDAEGGDDPLAVFAATGLSYTRAGLRLRAQDLASALLALGVQPGDRVAVLLPNTPEYLELVFACSLIGAAVVHLHTAAQGHMLERPLRLTQPACIFLTSDAARRLDQIELPEGLRVVTVGKEEAPGALDFGELTQHDAQWPAGIEQHESRAPICIYSSSGTTGPAKGVTLSHNALYAMADTAQIVMDFGPDDVAYVVTPFYHANAIVFMLLAAARAGSQTVFAERFSLSRFWGEVARYRATRTSLVGSAAALLLSQPETATDRDNSLELVAAVPRPRNAEAFERRFGITLTEFYGSTEANLPLGVPAGTSRPKTCGRLLPGWECKIVDAYGDELPANRDGELLVRPGAPGVVSSGYWGEPDRTVELWQDLWIHTGDLMRRDEDGWFFYVDRLKDAIRVSGENVASADIDVVLFQHSGVKDAATFGVASELGEQDIMVAVVMEDGVSLDPGALRKECEAQLPYFAVPRYFEQFETLPRTPTERVKKSELRARGVTQTTIDLGRPRRPKP